MNIFASISEDGTMRQWDFGEFMLDKISNLCVTTERTAGDQPVVNSMDPSTILTSFDCSNDFYAAVGCKDGTIRVN